MKQFHETALLCHPDKIELFLLNTAHNSLLLPHLFPELVDQWTRSFKLVWRTEVNSWHWTTSGWNDQIRLTFFGPAKDISHDSWHENIFSRDHLSHLYRHNRRGWAAILRITDKTKTQPEIYCQYLTEIFCHVESEGIQEKPRTIEIALDSYDRVLSKEVRHTVYLRRDAPFDFSHWSQGRICSGGSPDGTHTEYSMLHTFRNRRGDLRRQNTTRRELVCYTNQEHCFFRVELRLGSRYLSEFHESDAYHRAIECSEVPPLTRSYPVRMHSRTLDLLGFAPYFIRRQIAFCAIDLAALHRLRPATRFLSLKDKTLREQRYRLAQRGIRPALLALPPPRVRFLFPSQVSLHS